MAKIAVALDGPFAHPSAEEVAVERAEARAAGLPDGHPKMRRQMVAVNSGKKVPHELAHAHAGGRKSKRNQSSQNDARARRNLAKNSKPLPPPLGRG